MEYAVSNFQELLMDCNVDSSMIKQVTLAWGEEFSGEWEGGFCFETYDGEYFIIVRKDDGSTFVDSSLDSSFNCPVDDFVENPIDIQNWLNDGADPDEIYEY